MDAQECAAGMCYSIHSRRVIYTYACMHRSVRQACVTAFTLGVLQIHMHGCTGVCGRHLCARGRACMHALPGGDALSGDCCYLYKYIIIIIIYIIIMRIVGGDALSGDCLVHIMPWSSHSNIVCTQ